MKNSSLIEYRTNGPTISENPLDPRLNPNFKYKESNSNFKILKWTSDTDIEPSKSFQDIKDTKNIRCSSNKQKLTSSNSCSVLLKDCSKIVISDSKTHHAVKTNPTLNSNLKTNQICKLGVCQCMDAGQTFSALEKLNSKYDKLHVAEDINNSKTIRNLNSSSCKFRCKEEIEILNRYKSLKESYSSPQSQYSIIERFNNRETSNCQELHQNKNLQTNCSSTSISKRFENNYESSVDFRCPSNNNETYNISSVDETKNYTEIDLHLQVIPTNRKEKEQFSSQRPIPKTLDENHKQSNIITDNEIMFLQEIYEKRLISQNFCDKNDFKSAEKENEQDSNTGKSSKLYEDSKNGAKSSNSSMTENCLRLELNLADQHLTVEHQDQDSTKVNSCLHDKRSSCTLDGLNKNPDITNSDNSDQELCMRQLISKDLGGENHKCSAKNDICGKHTEIDLHLQVTPTNIKAKEQYRPQHAIPKMLDENPKPSNISLITDNEFMFLQEILSEKRLISQNFCDKNNFKRLEKKDKEESNSSKLDEHSKIETKSSDNSMNENYLKLESNLVDQHFTVEHKDLDSTKTNSCLYSKNVKRFICNPDDSNKTPNITHSDNIDELHQSQLISKDLCGENHKLIMTLNNPTKNKFGLVKADQNFGNEGNFKSTVVRHPKVRSFIKSRSKQNFPTRTFKCVRKRNRKTFNTRKPVIYQNSKHTLINKKYSKGNKCKTLKSNIIGKLLKAKKYNANRLSHFRNIKINSYNNVAKEMIVTGKENKCNETEKCQSKSNNELFSQAQLNSRVLQEENPESKKAVAILTDISLTNEFKWKSAAERKFYVFSEINTQSGDGNENSNDETRQSDTPESEKDSLMLKCDSIDNHEMDNIVKNDNNDCDNIDNFCNPSTEKSNSNKVETLDRTSDPSLPTILCRTANFSLDSKVQPYVSKKKLLEILKNFLVSRDVWLKFFKSNQDYANCCEKAVAFERYIKDSLNLKYPLNVWDVSKIISAKLNSKSSSLLQKFSNLRFFNLSSWTISPSIKRKSVFLGEKANVKCYDSSDLPLNQNQISNTKLVKIQHNSSIKDIISFEGQESSFITSSSLKRKCDFEEPHFDLPDTYDSMYIYSNHDEKQSGYLRYLPSSQSNNLSTYSMKRLKGDVDNATQIKQFISLNKHNFMNLGLQYHPTFVPDESCEKLFNETDCETEDVTHEKQNYNSLPLELQSFESLVYDGPCNSNYNENEKIYKENYSEIKNKEVIQEKQKSSFSQDQSYTSNSDKVVSNPIPQINQKYNTTNKKIHSRIPFIQDESSWDSIFDESDTQAEIKTTVDFTQETQKSSFIQEESCESIFSGNVSKIKNKTVIDPVKNPEQKCDNMQNKFQNRIPFISDESSCESSFDGSDSRIKINVTIDSTQVKGVQKPSFILEKLCENIFNENDSKIKNKIITNPVEERELICDNMYHKFQDSISFNQDKSSWDIIFNKNDCQVENKVTNEPTQAKAAHTSSIIQDESWENICSGGNFKGANKIIIKPIQEAEQQNSNFNKKCLSCIPYFLDESPSESIFDNSEFEIKNKAIVNNFVEKEKQNVSLNLKKSTVGKAATDQKHIKSSEKCENRMQTYMPFINDEFSINAFNKNLDKPTNCITEKVKFSSKNTFQIASSIVHNNEKNNPCQHFIASEKGNMESIEVIKNKKYSENLVEKCSYQSSLINDTKNAAKKREKTKDLKETSSLMYANFKETSNPPSKIIQGDSFNSDGKHSETFNSFDLNSKCIQNGILKNEVEKHSNKKSAREISNLIHKDSREVSNFHNFSSNSFSDKNFEINKCSEIIVMQEASGLIHTGVKRNLNSLNSSSESKQHTENVNFDNSRTKQTLYMPNRFPTCHIPPVTQGNKFPHNGINSLVLEKGHLHHISPSTNKICHAENQYKISLGSSNFTSVDSNPLNAINLPPVTTCNPFVNVQNDIQKKNTSDLPLDLSKTHSKLICNNEYSFDKKENTSSFNSSKRKSINEDKTIINECNVVSLENPSKKAKSVGRRRNKNLSKTQDASSDRMPSPKPRRTRGKKSKQKKIESPNQSNVSYSSENVEDIKSNYEKLKNPYAYLFKPFQEETKPIVNAQKEKNSKIKNPGLLSSNNNKIESHMTEMTMPNVSFEDVYLQRGSTAISPFENAITNVRRQEIEPFLVSKHANLLTNKEENSYCPTFTPSKRKAVAHVENVQKKNKQRKTEITKKSPNHLQLASIKNDKVKICNEARIDPNVSLKPNLINSFNTLHSYIVSSVDMIDKDINFQSNTAEENEPDFPMKQFKNFSSSPSSRNCDISNERELNNEGSFKSHTKKFCNSKNIDNDNKNSVSSYILTNQPALAADNNTEAEKHASSLIRDSSGFISLNSNRTSSPRFSQFYCCDPITTEKLFSDFSGDGMSTSPSNYLKKTVKPVLKNPGKHYPGVIKINKESSKSPLRYDVFKSNCKYNKEKVPCQKCDVAYHDDLFEENGLFPKYWKHVNGFEYHGVDLSCVTKKRSDLSGDQLETYDFLYSQLFYHALLFQYLIHKASQLETDTNFPEIIEQLDYIAGYEMACKALLL